MWYDLQFSWYSCIDNVNIMKRYKNKLSGVFRNYELLTIRQMNTKLDCLSYFTSFLIGNMMPLKKCVIPLILSNFPLGFFGSFSSCHLFIIKPRQNKLLKHFLSWNFEKSVYLYSNVTIEIACHPLEEFSTHPPWTQFPCCDKLC